MKQKSQNRFLAALLAVAMMLQMLPMLAFADDAPDAHAVKIDGKEGSYETLKAAVIAAQSGDTIILGEGNYTLYGTNSVGTTKGKNLTFVGQGPEVTAWNIGAEEPDPNKFGTEYNGDYSFDGAGKITFKNMTLHSGDANYLGFIRADQTVVDNCVINGKTFYWGYTSAVFTDTTFNAPSGDYAIWTYSSPTMTFDTCTFNASGKVINVYTDGTKQDITVNFNNCTVNSNFSESAGKSKTALNINDSNMGNYKYIININDPTVTAARDTMTCSQVFGFGGKSACNTGKTEVYWNNSAEPVWKDGKMQTHSYIDVVNHTLTVTGGIVTVKNGDKDVTDTLTVTTDEATGKKTYSVPKDAKVTVTLDKTLIPEGMVFDIWSTGKFSLPLGQDYKAETITFTMSSDVDIAAQYRDATIEDDGPGVLGTVAIIGTAAVGGAVLGYQAYSLGAEFAGKLMALPYFPSNRSALAMMLWEDAGKPMPESEILYPDVGQEEQDMDLQHAARWAMEHDLLPDLNDQDTELPPEQVKFYPDNMVTKISVLRAWKKAQDLKQNAQ